MVRACIPCLRKGQGSARNSPISGNVDGGHLSNPSPWFPSSPEDLHSAAWMYWAAPMCQAQFLVPRVDQWRTWSPNSRDDGWSPALVGLHFLVSQSLYLGAASHASAPCVFHSLIMPSSSNRAFQKIMESGKCLYIFWDTLKN